MSAAAVRTLGNMPRQVARPRGGTRQRTARSRTCVQATIKGQQQSSSDGGGCDEEEQSRITTTAKKLVTTRRRAGGMMAAAIAAIGVTGGAGMSAVAAEDDAVVPYVDGPEGLRYYDVTVGTGPEPFEGDVLKANYQVNLVADGKKVDSAKFFVFGGGTGEVIRGWDMAVMGTADLPPMKVGGVRKVLIPPELAYGSKGAGCSSDGTCRVPPDAALDFTIELVGIKGV